MNRDAEVRPKMPGNLTHLLLALILAISAFIQSTVVTKTVVDSPIRADAGEYFNYAYNLRHYGVYSLARTWDSTPAPPAPAPDKLRSPGYPIFLLLAGEPEPVEAFGHKVVLLQAAMGVLSVWFIFLISKDFLGRWLALTASLLAATAPQLATINTYLLSEGLFTFLLLASTLSLVRAVQSGRLRLFAISGLMWGLCSLVRPTAEFFPLILFVSVLVLPRFRNFRRGALIGVACFSLALTPWIIRNHGVPDGGPDSSLMLKTLAHGSYPGFMYQGRPETFGYPYRFDPEAIELTRDLPTTLRGIANKFKSDPAEYASWYLIGKPYFFLSLKDVQSLDIMIYPTLRTPYYDDFGFAVMRRASLWLHWPLMLLAMLGMAIVLIRPRWIFLDLRPGQAGQLVALIIAYAILFHIIAAPFPRYAIPFRPLLFALALIPIRAAWLALRGGLGRDDLVTRGVTK